MYECVSIGYTYWMVPLKIKDAGLRLRVEREIRQEFVEACRGEGKTAAQVLREYMRDYIARNRATAQQELFSQTESAVSWQAGQEKTDRNRPSPTPAKQRRDRSSRHP